MVPDFEIYVNENLTFFVHVYLWKVPINHEIYTSNDHSLKNITLSNLVHVFHSYELCVSIKKDTSFLSSAYIKRVIPKIFLPSEETTSIKSNQIFTFICLSNVNNCKGNLFNV